MEELSADTAKSLMKFYNKNMYKVISIMAFGDFAAKVHKICQPGSIIAILNPKYMAPRPGTTD